MPFGLVNAQSTFQRLMEDVLQGLQWVDSLLYMDDIIKTPGETVDQYLQRLENVFIRLRESKLKLKPSKCVFFHKSVKFLRHIVSEEGLRLIRIKFKWFVTGPFPGTVKKYGAS